MKKPPQRVRVLRSLQNAGEYGITQGDWLKMGVDGRGAITRVAARIVDLKARGHNIVEAGERDGFRVYRLVTEPERLPEPVAEERLFTPPPMDALRAA